MNFQHQTVVDGNLFPMVSRVLPNEHAQSQSECIIQIQLMFFLHQMLQVTDSFIINIKYFAIIL